METEEYKQSLAFLPDIVFIKLGTNDSKPQNIKYKRKFKSDYLKLIRSYQELSSHPRIILLGPVRCFLSPDDNIKESVIQGMLAPVIKEIAKEDDVQFLSESAYADACRPGNPRDTSVEEIAALYRSLM